MLRGHVLIVIVRMITRRHRLLLRRQEGHVQRRLCRLLHGRQCRPRLCIAFPTAVSAIPDSLIFRSPRIRRYGPVRVVFFDVNTSVCF